MTDDDKADVQLARDVLTETLHGPVPMATVARLAQAVLRLDDARRWRKLTGDPATWPASDQPVVLRATSGEPKWFALRWIEDGGPAHPGWTHWLPLPPPSEEDGR